MGKIQWRMLVKLLLLLPEVSCITMKNNYLGAYQTDDYPDSGLTVKLNEMITRRNKADRYADSLVYLINTSKVSNKPLGGSDVNHLYEIFREQLTCDIYFNSLLHLKNSSEAGTRMAGKTATGFLLRSAATYNRLYEKNRYLRRTLNAGDQGNNIFPGTLRKSQLFLFSTGIRRSFRKEFPYDEMNLSVSSPNYLPQTNAFRSVFTSISRRNDRLNSLGKETVTIIGDIFLRRNYSGCMKDELSRENARLLLPELKPFDILVIKSNHKLSNTIIPGYFSHVSIWLGSETINYKDSGKVSSGSLNAASPGITDKCMVESITTGSRLCSLLECSDAVTMIIIRPEMNDYQKTRIKQNIIRQLGKKYDYNLNIEMSDRIYCTELVFLGYDYIRWIERPLLGRYNILPDDILNTALLGNGLEIKAMIKDKKLIRNPNINEITGLYRRADKN
jgi:hypothetical protein